MPKHSRRRTADKPMLCFEVFRNGKKIGTAGVKAGMLSVSLMYFASRRARGRVIPADTYFRLGGIERDSEDDDGHHVEWAEGRPKPGDEFLIKFITSPTRDEPKVRPRKKRRQPAG